jgi:hypothetical protein
MIPNPVLETTFISKETTYTLDFRVILLYLFGVILSAFGKFIEDFLRNLTCWEKIKNGVVIAAENL